MAKARNWSALTHAYRRRLERGGVTEQQYMSGTPLAKARGHTSTRKEAEDSYFYRDRNRFVQKMVTVYGRDEESVRDALIGMSRGEIEDAIAQQRQAEREYNAGRKSPGSNIWKNRNRHLPDWMYYYHGLFS